MSGHISDAENVRRFAPVTHLEQETLDACERKLAAFAQRVIALSQVPKDAPSYSAQVTATREEAGRWRKFCAAEQEKLGVQEEVGMTPEARLKGNELLAYQAMLGWQQQQLPEQPLPSEPPLSLCRAANDQAGRLLDQFNGRYEAAEPSVAALPLPVSEVVETLGVVYQALASARKSEIFKVKEGEKPRPPRAQQAFNRATDTLNRLEAYRQTLEDLLDAIDLLGVKNPTYAHLIQAYSPDQLAESPAEESSPSSDSQQLSQSSSDQLTVSPAEESSSSSDSQLLSQSSSDQSLAAESSSSSDSQHVFGGQQEQMSKELPAAPSPERPILACLAAARQAEHLLAQFNGRYEAARLEVAPPSTQVAAEPSVMALPLPVSEVRMALGVVDQALESKALQKKEGEKHLPYLAGRVLDRLQADRESLEKLMDVFDGLGREKPTYADLIRLPTDEGSTSSGSQQLSQSSSDTDISQSDEPT